jgi:hypothetical protein
MSIRGISFAAVLLATVYTALGADPAATQPATTAPTIDKVVPLPLISLKTKGMSPRDALAAISKQTGVAIYPFGYDVKAESEVSATSPKWDLWASRKFDPLDFDLDGVSFWQAMRRITARAGLTIDYGGLDVVVDKNPGWGSLPAPSAVSEVCPEVLGAIPLDVARNYNGDPNNAPIDMGTDKNGAIRVYGGGGGYSDLFIFLYVDPRIRICSMGDLHLDVATDGTGHALPERHCTVQIRPESLWQVCCMPSLAPVNDGTNRIGELRGYLPVSIVTSMKSVILPFKLGYKQTVGPWVIEVADFTKWIMAGNQNYAAERALVSFEYAGERTVPLPGTLVPLVRAVDSKGQALAPDGDPYPPRISVSGGERAWLDYSTALANGDYAEPAGLQVDVPLKIENAIIPFDFKDIPLQKGN